MMTERTILTKGWEAYELLDSGDNRKLERFGSVVLDRPDPQSLWRKNYPERWNDAHAYFSWADKTEIGPDRKGGLVGERWKIHKDIGDSWNITWGTMKLTLSMKGFKHIGIFPEHSEQWKELQSLGENHHGLRMLNLFGYTGAASIVGALSGMEVTHVDASKTTLATVKENMQQSGLAHDALRMICEDSLKYVKRLIARGEQFEIIVLDPPAFGRGPKGEVWKIEESLYELVSVLPALVSPQGKMVVLNGYASGYSARTFGELLQGAFPEGDITYGDIGIQERDTKRSMTTGIYSAWKN